MLLKRRSRPDQSETKKGYYEKVLMAKDHYQVELDERVLYIESAVLRKSEELDFEAFVDELIEWNRPFKEKACR